MQWYIVCKKKDRETKTDHTVCALTKQGTILTVPFLTCSDTITLEPMFFLPDFGHTFCKPCLEKVKGLQVDRI